MSTSYEYWDELCERVKKLRDQCYTILQIEDETGIDYEDILWAIAQDERLQEMRMRESLEKHNYLAHVLREEDIE